MFDDQQNANGVPGNLPMEPVDMFAGTEKDLSGDEMPSEIPQIPNALSAGLLKKKDAVTSNIDINNTTVPVLASTNTMYEMKQPFLGKILLSVLLLAVLGGIGFGGWYFYKKFTNTKTVVVVPVVSTTNSDTQIPSAPVDNTPVQTVSSSVNSGEVTASMNNDKILFGESVDSDNDGLDDVREKQLGTDSKKADTDADGLNDGDEVIIWKTSPLNLDTDGDTYTDGSEVFHGYNPLGTGKLFNVPSSTTSVSTSSVNNSIVKSTTTVKNTTTKK